MRRNFKELAREFKALCHKYGWKFSTRSSIVIITRTIADMDEFVDADQEYGFILSSVPQSEAGSVWGTDGGGVGAIAAMRSGLFEMKKSGVSKQFIKELQKI